MLHLVLRIRDVYPRSDFFPSRIPDPGSWIPDPNCLHSGSRIHIKQFKYFNPKKPKKWFLSSRKYDPGCSSRIPDTDADFLPIPDPRSRGSKRHRIPDPDPQHWLHLTEPRGTLLSSTAPYWATLHLTELRCTLLSYTVPTKLLCALLS